LHAITEISDNRLRKDIALMKSLNKSDFSLSVHMTRYELDERTDRILGNFNNGTLQLRPEQYQLFAEYINVCGHNNEKSFDRLQQLADFDVRESAKMAKRTLWQKIFRINPYKVKYRPAEKLKKQMNKYLDTQEELESGLAKSWIYTRNERLHQDGISYIQAYLDGKINIKPEDVKAFRKFVKVMDYPIYEGSLGDQVLKKLDAEMTNNETPVVETVAEHKPQKISWYRRLKNKAYEQIANIKTKTNEQITNIKSNEKIAKIKEKSPFYAKIFGIAAATATAVILLIGKGSSDTKVKTVDKNIDKTEIKAQITTESSQNLAEAKTIQINPQTNLEENKPNQEDALTCQWQPVSTYQFKMPEKTDTMQATHEVVREVKTDAKRQALVNHHNHVLDMRLGSKKKDARYEKIEEQIQKGIFTLPDSIGKEEFAYALEMYNAYGIDCSLNEALNSNQKLSQTANNRIAEEIAAAGETGLGVKKMAEKKYNGHMNNNSVYDRASKKSQHQHNMNLQQWRQAKKMSSRAA